MPRHYNSHIRKTSKTSTPAKPRVREPAVWSNSVQDILYLAHIEARNSFRDLTGIDVYSTDILAGRPSDKKEYYGMMCHFIDRAKPGGGASHKGLSVDRAEAKLLLWLQMFAWNK